MISSYIFLPGVIGRSLLVTLFFSFFFFFNDTATTEIYTLSLHDALPISAAPHGFGVVRVRCFLAAGDEQHAEHGASNPDGARGTEALAGKERQRDGQHWIARGEWGDHGHFSDFKGAVEAERGDGVDTPGQGSPSPRLPAGAVGEMAPAAEPWEREGEQDEPDELHVQQSAQSAHALGAEAREEIGTAPGQRRKNAQQNSHGGLGGLARGLTRGGRCGFFSLQ